MVAANAVDPVVHLVKCFDQHVQVAVGETGRLRIEPNFDFPGLVLIAAEERVLEPPHAFRHACRLHEVIAVGAQSAQELIHTLGVELPAAGVKGAILLPAQIRDQAAERRQAGDKSWNR